jgi:hypothetical protein
VLDDRFNKNWGSMLYLHPAVSKLAQSENRPPTYIPTSIFTMAIVDIIMNEGKDVKFSQDPDTLKITYEGDNLKPDDPMANFITGLNRMEESEVKALFTSFVMNSGKNFEKMKDYIGKWYDDYMDRVTGWYKRDVKKILFAIGLVVTIVFNVNSFALVDSIWKNSNLRNTVVGAAETYLKNNPEGPSKDSVKSIGTLKSKTDSVYDYLSVLGLPIGWQGCKDTAVPKEPVTHKVSEAVKKLSRIDNEMLSTIMKIGAGKHDFDSAYSPKFLKVQDRYDSINKQVFVYTEADYIDQGTISAGLSDTMKILNKLHHSIDSKINRYLLSTKDSIPRLNRISLDSEMVQSGLCYDEFKSVDTLIKKIDSIKGQSNYKKLTPWNLVLDLPENKAQSLSMACNCDHRLFWGKILYWFRQWSLLGVIGWLCTAGALSFGASFWFDMLKKLVNVRGGGSKPDKNKSDDSLTK